MKLHSLFALALGLVALASYGFPAYAYSDSDGGYETPDRDPEVSDQDPEFNDQDCEDCDPPVEPEPEPEPEPALDNGRGGTCSGCDPYNGR